MYIQRSVFVERHTGLTFIAGFTFRRMGETVDGFGKDPGTGCFPNATRTAEQVSVSEFIVNDGVFKGRGK
jgi:hypothetical protein